MTEIYRFRENSEPDSPVRCRMHVQNEKLDKQAALALINSIPDDGIDAKVNIQMVSWTEPSTLEERQRWVEWQAARDERHREWVQRRYLELFGESDD